MDGGHLPGRGDHQTGQHGVLVEQFGERRGAAEVPDERPEALLGRVAVEPAGDAQDVQFEHEHPAGEAYETAGDLAARRVPDGRAVRGA